MQIAGENASMSAGLSPWWDAGRHADRRPFLLARDRIRRAIRSWFEAGGFLEVETATLQASPGAGAHLHGVRAPLLAPDGQATDAWLRTSPEFACKSLLAAGETRIFEFGRVWRDRERGALHHPEFTMLEWYRAGEPYEALMADCAALLALAAEAAGTQELVWRGGRCDPFAAPERLSVVEAFERFAGFDLMASVDGGGEGDRDALARMASEVGARVSADDTWSDVFSKMMVERIEPRLGHGRATILHGYPAAEAALARRAPGDPRLAERFELYACGVELANAFGELTDPVEQRRRLEAEFAEMERVHGYAPPLDEGFLAALARMPEASGCALGFDRLVMLASGARRIEEVLWSPAP